MDTKERNRLYRLNNKELIKEKAKIYRDAHKEELQIYNKRYQETHKDKMRSLYKKYQEENKSKIKNYYKIKRQNDILFKISCNLRSAISTAFKKQNYQKNSKTQEILGCSFEEFKNYLESKFEVWMCYENYGKYNGTENYGWDIDHIIPLSSVKTEEDIIQLNHYTNLQPLCSYINRDIKFSKKDN